MKDQNKDKRLDLENIEFAKLMLPSIKTTLIECKYEFEVSFEHKGLTFGSKIPEAKLYVNIFPPQLKS